MGYWAQHEYIDNGHAEWAATISPPMFDFFENYFNLAFDFPKTGKYLLNLKSIFDIFVGTLSVSV